MSEITGGLPPAAAHYRTFGDERPPLQELIDMHTELSEAAEHRLTLHLVRSEIALDAAAADRPNAGLWVARSGEALDAVDDWAKHLRRDGEVEQYAACAPAMASVLWRRTELPNWLRATQGENLQNEYEQLLQAAKATLPLIDRDPSKHIQDRFTEFLILLLGARKKYLEPDKGCLGRLALNREENRSEVRTDVPVEAIENPNWDTGITQSWDGLTFIYPQVVFQSKATLKTMPKDPEAAAAMDPKEALKTADAYRRAGVVAVSAKGLGMRDSVAIVLGCMDEMESLPAGTLRRHNVTSTSQLNSITQRMRRWIPRKSKWRQPPPEPQQDA